MTSGSASSSQAVKVCFWNLCAWFNEDRIVERASLGQITARIRRDKPVSRPWLQAGSRSQIVQYLDGNVSCWLSHTATFNRMGHSAQAECTIRSGYAGAGRSTSRLTRILRPVRTVPRGDDEPDNGEPSQTTVTMIARQDKLSDGAKGYEVERSGGAEADAAREAARAV